MPKTRKERSFLASLCERPARKMFHAALEDAAMKLTIPCLAVALVLWCAFTSVATVNGSPVLQKRAANAAGQPIEITAQKLNLKFGKKSARAAYDGNVKVKQGDVTMSCDHLVIDFETKHVKPGPATRDPKLTSDVTFSNMKSITASGNVKIVQGDRKAMAGKAVFDNRKRTIELTDNPKLWQGPDYSSGNRIVFYIDENRSEADGVTTRISPVSPKKEQGK